MANYRLQDFMDIARALADESRVRTLLALKSPVVKQALEWVSGSLEEAMEITHDRKHLEEIVGLEPEALCQLQRSRP
ncbi:MAG: hypothetical protein P8020_16260 [Acidobacteriota bacterium]